MKKAQVQTQIFVYVLALIVVGLVLIYGYNAVQGFIQKSDEVAVVQFKTELSNAIETQSHEYMSVTRKEILLPRQYDYMLAIDLSQMANSSFQGKYPLVYDSWSANASRNIFLLGKKNLVESFYVDNIVFFGPDNVMASSSDRVIKLKLTGRGGKTQVELWPE